MKYYFAPMEGITLANFRRIHRACFPGADAYFAPFVVANQTFHFHKKEIRDLLPENNRDIPLIPQVLTNKPDQMLWACQELMKFGYREINLNLGCPMPQVAKRGRGSGFLSDPELLDRFFDAVFEGLAGMDIRLSVKTRLGTVSPGEAYLLMKVYNRYPLHEIIIHPRLMKDLYKGSLHMEVFREMAACSVNPVCYNGDLLSPEDVTQLLSAYPVDRIMIGRGLLRNPALIRQLQGQPPAAISELKNYHDRLFDSYLEMLPDGRQAVTKMKEIWSFWHPFFFCTDRQLKALRKSTWPDQYTAAVREILS